MYPTLKRRAAFFSPPLRKMAGGAMIAETLVWKQQPLFPWVAADVSNQPLDQGEGGEK